MRATPIWLPEIEGGSHIRRVVLNDDEYLLIENRFLAPDVAVELEQDPTTHVVLGPRYPEPARVRFPAAGGGVLIWHVDEFVIRRDFALNMDPESPRAGADRGGWPGRPGRSDVAVHVGECDRSPVCRQQRRARFHDDAGPDDSRRQYPPVIVSVLDPIQFEMRVSVVFDATTATLFGLFPRRARR